jgi:hypothetical protein
MFHQKRPPMDRIVRHGTKRTVLMVPETMVVQLMTRIQVEMLYGLEGQTKTKERILQ